MDKFRPSSGNRRDGNNRGSSDRKFTPSNRGASGRSNDRGSDRNSSRGSDRGPARGGYSGRSDSGDRKFTPSNRGSDSGSSRGGYGGDRKFTPSNGSSDRGSSRGGYSGRSNSGDRKFTPSNRGSGSGPSRGGYGDRKFTPSTGGSDRGSSRGGYAGRSDSGNRNSDRGADRGGFIERKHSGSPRDSQRDSGRGEFKPSFRGGSPRDSQRSSGERNYTQSRDSPRQSGGNRRDFSQNRSERAPPFEEHRLKGVYLIKGNLATINDVPGQDVYGERLMKWDDIEYRIWDPKRSKLGAAIKKGISQIGILPDAKVLYLGCSTGTTVSHVGEMVGKGGVVYALDHAPRVMRDLLFNTEKRKNILPIMSDANKPEIYAKYVDEVDVVFMDISQRNQVEIFVKNCKAFLKKGGFGLLALKSRSVDITKSPAKIYAEARAELEEYMTIVDYRELDPFEIDHAFFVVKNK